MPERLSEREIQRRIARGAGEPSGIETPTATEKCVGVLLKIPVRLKDRLDRHVKAFPSKRASWILLAIHEKLKRDAHGGEG
jgi:hypothetical protein